MSAGAALVEVDNLVVDRGGRAVVKGVSFVVARGGTHAILGPNGIGKSTLLMAVLGLLPFHGRIRLHFGDDNDVVGYVPQRFVADRSLPVTVEDFLGASRQRRPVCLGVSRATRVHVRGLLERVDLASVQEQPLSSLSGGQMQRVLLAHAIDPLPALLVLDEPGAGLDAASSSIMETLLTELKTEGVTSLLVAHDRAQIDRLCDGVTELVAA